MPQDSILDARLAEIDRRLRTIQSELATTDDPPRSVDERSPAPAAATSPSPGLPGELAEAGRLVAQLHELTAAHERLLTSSRELLAAFSDALANAQPRPAEPAAPIGVAVGPFADTAALRRFEESLSVLPEVRSVVVREYAGTDRVIVDVLLSGPTS